MTSNDRQTDGLDKLPNTFEEVNRVWCFNHTIQLSVKGLLKPFYSAGSIETDDPGVDDDDEEEEEDSIGALDDNEREELINNTEAVCTMLNKVCLLASVISLSLHSCSLLLYICKLSFAIVHSTTIALPAWHEACATHSLHVRLIPRDVKTQWNSTYDMLNVAMEYRKVINDITANKSLKLQQYELNDEGWDIIRDLLCVLKITYTHLLHIHSNIVSDV